MAGINYGMVQTLIAVDNPMVRKGIRDAFKQAGFRLISEAQSHVQLNKALNENAFDLVVMTPDIAGFFVAPLIAEIRNGRLGPHPFPVTMALLPVGDRDYVRKVIDCGPDDMLLMPVSPGQLLSRIEMFVRMRKPFVVTQDYTGPDRRRERRPGTEEIPLVEVPNPLRARVRDVPTEVLAGDFTRAAERLDVLKIERYVVQIRWLDDAIRRMFAEESVDAVRLQGFALRFQQIAEDLPARLAGQAGEELTNALAELTAVAQGLQSEGAKSGAGQIDAVSAAVKRLAGLLVPSAKTR